MAGAGETIVLDPAKPALERAEATQMRAKMLQESVGSVGKNIMDMVTQYQDIKQQKQKGDLASLTMAGTMVGGMDNLPQDAKNKIPGILGVPLPTDEQGNVKITPDTDTLIKRMTVKMIQDDPELAKIAMGFQEKKGDPFKMANDVRLQEMTLAGQREKTAAENARNKADNDVSIQKTLLEGQSREQAAIIAATGRKDAAGIRAAAGQALDKPSPYVLDPATNTMMTEPQWYSTHPNEQMPTKLSYRDANTISSQQKSAAAIESSHASIEANKSRLKAANFKLDTMITNKDLDPASKRMSLLVSSYRLAKGTDKEAAMKDLLNKEIPNIMLQAGFKEEDIAALGTMAGEGGWGDWALNKFNSAMGVTSTNSGSSLLQPMVATIPGVSPSALNTVVGAIRGKSGSTATAAPSPSGPMSTAEFQRRYPKK